MWWLKKKPRKPSGGYILKFSQELQLPTCTAMELQLQKKKEI
jgi:hypothetical protein